MTLKFSENDWFFEVMEERDRKNCKMKTFWYYLQSSFEELLVLSSIELLNEDWFSLTYNYKIIIFFCKKIIKDLCFILILIWFFDFFLKEWPRLHSFWRPYCWIQQRLPAIHHNSFKKSTLLTRSISQGLKYFTHLKFILKCIAPLLLSRLSVINP